MSIFGVSSNDFYDLKREFDELKLEHKDHKEAFRKLLMGVVSKRYPDIYANSPAESSFLGELVTKVRHLGYRIDSLTEQRRQDQQCPECNGSGVLAPKARCNSKRKQGAK